MAKKKTTKDKGCDCCKDCKSDKECDCGGKCDCGKECKCDVPKKKAKASKKK
jgi:hypothetical protein